MIFTETHAAQVLDGRKWQTRRPVKPGDIGLGPADSIYCVYHNNWLKWQVGKTYAVQPGRGKKALGRTPPLKEIRRERLQKMNLQDLQAEMGQPGVGYILVFFFIEIWDYLYRKPYRWEDNPEVWALEFERVKEAGETLK